MARTKGSANLAASLEILAEAPVDARTVVAAESDLTVAANFPYAYVGMPVYVKATQKMYILTATPVTTASNWKEVGSGGSSLPDGGTTGQALVKHSNTDQDVEWATIDGTPSGGTTGQLLAKKSNTDGDVEWVNAPSSIPDGGTTGQVLAKHSNTDNDVEWAAVHNVPAGGTAGQVLTKNSGTDYDSVWGTPSYFKYEAKTLGVSHFTYNNAELVGNGESKIFYSVWPSGETYGTDPGLPDSSAVSYYRFYYVEMTKAADGGHFTQRCRKFYTLDNKNYCKQYERQCIKSGSTWTYSDWIELTADALLPVTPNQFDKANMYSTTEKVVGSWTDGRPLYQKTVSWGLITSGNPSKNHGISNINAVIDCKGYWVQDNTYFGPVGESNPNESLYVYADKTKMYLVASNGFGDGKTYAYITFQYTKTTDAANSFNYASENDYSTTEKIVGTWIDGKPLYQKVVETTSPASKNTFGEVYNLGTTCIIRKADAYISNGNGNVIIPLSYQAIVLIMYNMKASDYTGKNGCITMCVQNEAAFLSKAVKIIVQYTKTTD